MIRNLFTTPIFKTKIEYENKSMLSKLLEEEFWKNINNTPKNWKCNVHSSFGQNNKNIPNDLTRLIIEKSIEYLSNISNNISIENKYYMNEIWYNVYGKDSFQEPHTHGDSLFSGCYYLKFNKKKHHQTIFYNPNFSLDYSKLENNPYFCNNLECEEDDLIIFPSSLLHGTRGIKNIKSNDDIELRITISFNILNSKILLNSVRHKKSVESKLIYR